MNGCGVFVCYQKHLESIILFNSVIDLYQCWWFILLHQNENVYYLFTGAIGLTN